MIMNDPKKKNVKKQVRRVEDELGVDSETEDLVEKILDLFSSDDEDEDESNDSSSDEDDDDSDDFGDGDFGGGGASDDW